MRTPLAYGRDVVQEFTGHERDEISSLDYMKLRYYQPQYGRFNRPDPKRDLDLTNPTSFNLYAYVRGNPVNFTDPTGGETDDPRSVPGHRWSGWKVTGSASASFGAKSKFGSVGEVEVKGKVDSSGSPGFDLSIGPLIVGISWASFGGFEDIGLEKVTIKVEYGVKTNPFEKVIPGADKGLEIKAGVRGRAVVGIEMSFIENVLEGWVHHKVTPYGKGGVSVAFGQQGNPWSVGLRADLKHSLFSLEKLGPRLTNGRP